jgi:hypothetical protein
VLTAVDDEHAMSFVSQLDLESWRVDEGAVAATARANLVDAGVELGGPVTEPWVEVLAPNSYVTSWLAAPDILADVGRSALRGDFVALAPSRDTLRLVSLSDPFSLKTELERAVAEYQDAPRPLSPAPYYLDGGAVTPWTPPMGHPCETIVDRARQILAAVEYGHQGKTLESLFEKAGEDVYVANYNLMERPDGTVWSWSAWVKQVTDGLLPRTDYLAMGDNDTKDMFWVRWEDAERLAPGAMRAEGGYYPMRWRVHGWPAASVLTTLRAAAVSAPGGKRPEADR